MLWVWNIKDSALYFHHYGPLKNYVISSKEWYEEEMQMLHNCINIKGLDLSSVNNK